MGKNNTQRKSRLRVVELKTKSPTAKAIKKELSREARLIRTLRRLEKLKAPTYARSNAGSPDHHWGRSLQALATHLRRNPSSAEVTCLSLVIGYGPTPLLKGRAHRSVFPENHRWDSWRAVRRTYTRWLYEPSVPRNPRDTVWIGPQQGQVVFAAPACPPGYRAATNAERAVHLRDYREANRETVDWYAPGAAIQRVLGYQKVNEEFRVLMGVG
jgi:hypothetical protein